jgi:hypothetical protein
MARKLQTKRPAKVPAGKVAKVKEPARRTAAGKKRKATTKRKEPRDVTALITAGASVESVVPATRRGVIPNRVRQQGHDLAAFPGFSVKEAK